MATVESSVRDRDAPPPDPDDGRRHECFACFGGYITITIEEDGQEHDGTFPCRRCQSVRGA